MNQKELTTWSGSKVSAEEWPKVLLGWQREARRLKRINLRLGRRPKLKPQSLEYELTSILSEHCGERAHTHLDGGEGAVDTLCRIIAERDQAFLLLALDRLKRA